LTKKKEEFDSEEIKPLTGLNPISEEPVAA
jgi:hypothetical protein